MLIKRRIEPMFVVLLKFSTNKALASQHMDAHNAWIQRGLDAGVFLMVGSLHQGKGGVILANNMGWQDLQERLSDDPFVTQKVVIPEILEITPHITDERLGFLLG
jgi:uncharacterized protein YciI